MEDLGTLGYQFGFPYNLTADWSDRRFKKEIKNLDQTDTLSKVLKLQGVTYKWRQDDFPNRGFDDKTWMGLIAQDVEKVFPHFVSEDPDGYKHLKYGLMTTVLVEAIKELKVEKDREIDALKAENEALKSEYNTKIQTLTQRIEALEN